MEALFGLHPVVVCATGKHKEQNSQNYRIQCSEKFHVFVHDGLLQTFTRRGVASPFAYNVAILSQFRHIRHTTPHASPSLLAQQQANH